MSNSPKRKLAAIMFTDMVGYTALMQKEESKARELIERHRELMRPLVEKHNGEVLQFVGDGTFCVFDSAIEAVNSATEIQKTLASENEIDLRIGIHVGDVVSKGEEIYGDGVNVASRIEPLAEPGGVCISGRVYDDIRNQSDMDAVLLGEKTLKNVERPIKIYSLIGEGLKASNPFEEEKESSIVIQEVSEKSLAKKLMPWSAGALVVLLILFGLNWFGDDKQSQQAIAGENSIAVMYFENLTGDPSLNWIESGMVEMLTANLGKLEGLNVLSSQRLYDIMRQVSGKGSTVQKIDRGTATEIARKAGVRTMLLGSVLGTEGRLRLSTQLVEVPTGKLVGAEVLDVGKDGSMFSLVDTLTLRIASHLGVLQPEKPVDVNVAYTLTNSFEALKLYVDGVQKLNRSSWVDATKDLRAAVEIDTNFAMAYFHLGIAQGWLGKPEAKISFAKARDLADKFSERERFFIQSDLTSVMEGPKQKQALEEYVRRYPDEKYIWNQLGEMLYHNYWPRASVKAFLRAIELDQFFLLAYIHPIDFYIVTNQFDKARPLIAKALSIDSLNTSIHYLQATLDYAEGNSKRAAKRFEETTRLMGSDSIDLFVVISKGALALMDKNFGQAEKIANESIKMASLYRIFFIHHLAGLAVMQGKYKAAGQYIEEALQLDPNSVFQTYEKGLFELLRGRTGNAKLSAQRILTLHESDLHNYPEVLVLSNHLLFLSELKKGNVKEAQRVVLELESLVVGNENEYDFLYYDALARFECHNGNSGIAQEQFTRALNSATIIGYPYTTFRYIILEGLMKCKEREGSYAKLLQLTKELPEAPVENYWQSASATALWPRSMMRKAHAYEALGRTDEAIEVYEEFLILWKDADEEIPERKDSIKRLAALKQES